MELTCRRATTADAAVIWEILQDAIMQRRKDGSRQWQDGYPNPIVIQQDIDNGYGYILTLDNKIIAYAALIFGKEAAYEAIDGKWLTSGPYAVIHRMAVHSAATGMGIATSFFNMLEKICVENNIYSLKVDTNFDNEGMLKIMQKNGYTYCGEVYVSGGIRKAFEKILAGKQ